MRIIPQSPKSEPGGVCSTRVLERFGVPSAWSSFRCCCCSTLRAHTQPPCNRCAGASLLVALCVCVYEQMCARGFGQLQ